MPSVAGTKVGRTFRTAMGVENEALGPSSRRKKPAEPFRAVRPLPSVAFR